MDSIEELRTRLEEIRTELPNLRSDVALEQVDLNNQMDVMIEELTEYENEVYEILNHRVENIMPTEPNPAIEELYNESENYRQIIKWLGKDEDFIERFGFDRTIYEVGNGTNVDEVNESLREFNKDMTAIGIKLAASNFNYSSYTLRYMAVFYQNIDSENFLFTMKKCFDEIYWECPLILTHLELCIRSLVTNNKKIIVRHLTHLLNKALINAKSNKEEIIDKYVRTKIQYEELYYSDPYNMVEYFRNNRTELDKYISPSVGFDQLMGYFTETNYYYDLSNEDRTLFLNNIYHLYNDVREYEKIDKFKKLFEFVISVYNEKETYKGAYKKKLKEIAILEKEKNTLDKKNKVIRSKINRTKDSNVAKLNELNGSLSVINNELAKKIAEIKTELDNAYNIKFKETLADKLTPATTIYEVVVFLSKYYAVLYGQIGSEKKIEKEMVPILVDEFRHIQYAAHLTVMKSTSFLDYVNVKSLIEKKYTLYNIRINVPAPGTPDYETLCLNLKTLIRYNDLLRMSLSPEDIIVMLKFEDIEAKKKAEETEKTE